MLYTKIAGDISLGPLKFSNDWWYGVGMLLIVAFSSLTSIWLLKRRLDRKDGVIQLQRHSPWKHAFAYMTCVLFSVGVAWVVMQKFFYGKTSEATVNKILVLPEDTYIGARIPFCVNVEGRPDDVFSSTLGKLPWWSGIGLITHVPSVKLTALGSFQVGVGQFSQVVSQVSQGLEDNPLGTITGDGKKVWVIRLKIPTPEPQKDMGSIYIDSKSFHLAEKEAEVSFGEAWDACGHEATRFTSEGHSGLAVAMTELVVGGDVRAFNNTQSKAVDEAMKRASDPNDHSFNGTNALESARETTRAQITKVIEAMNKDIIAAKAKEGVETVVVVNFSDSPPQ